jgi:hypothetical protein
VLAARLSPAELAIAFGTAGCHARGQASGVPARLAAIWPRLSPQALEQPRVLDLVGGMGGRPSDAPSGGSGEGAGGRPVPGRT